MRGPVPLAALDSRPVVLATIAFLCVDAIEAALRMVLAACLERIPFVRVPASANLFVAAPAVATLSVHVEVPVFVCEMVWLCL